MGSRLFATARTWPAEYPIRDGINQVINCIRATGCATTEITPEDAGYTVENPEGARFDVVLHVVEYVMAGEPAFMGLVTRQVQKANPLCILRFNGSSWSIQTGDVFSTEKISDLYRHLKYYNIDVRLEGIMEEHLMNVYRETRTERPGATDRRM